MNVVNVVPMSSSSVPPPSPAAPHRPVMAEQVVAAIAPRPGGLYVDATVGAGGHTQALLAAGAGHVIGLDRDVQALWVAAARLERLSARIELVHGRFSEIATLLAERGIDRVDGIVADLGLSSMQLDDPARGMSFRRSGPIDMRMEGGEGETALELIERLDDEELTDVLHALGGERRARRVCRCIKQDFHAGRLSTTRDLRRAVVRAIGPARVGGVDPATRTFQALRIAVNRELFELEQLIEAAPRVLADGGVCALVSFHSLEDRMVKRAFRHSEQWQLLVKGPTTASDDEIDDNPRSRSAKLRAARRAPRSRGGQG